MSNKERIAKEIKRIKEQFADADEGIAEKIIQEVAFMMVTMEDLKEAVNKDGPIIYGKNGNGFDVRQENPAQKSYNTMIKNYLAAIKQLNELMPDQETGGALVEFLKQGKK